MAKHKKKCHVCGMVIDAYARNKLYSRKDGKVVDVCKFCHDAYIREKARNGK